MTFRHIGRPDQGVSPTPPIFCGAARHVRQFPDPAISKRGVHDGSGVDHVGDIYFFSPCFSLQNTTNGRAKIATVLFSAVGHVLRHVPGTWVESGRERVFDDTIRPFLNFCIDLSIFGFDAFLDQQCLVSELLFKYIKIIHLFISLLLFVSFVCSPTTFAGLAETGVKKLKFLVFRDF